MVCISRLPSLTLRFYTGLPAWVDELRTETHETLSGAVSTTNHRPKKVAKQPASKFTIDESTENPPAFCTDDSSESTISADLGTELQPKKDERTTASKREMLPGGHSISDCCTQRERNPCAFSHATHGSHGKVPAKGAKKKRTPPPPLPLLLHRSRR